MLLALALAWVALADPSVPQGPLVLDGSEASTGLPGSRYVVVQYSDFLCPHCARAWQVLLPAIQAENDVQLVFQPFPLTGACNPVLSNTTAPWDTMPRCRLAVAAECAHAQGKHTAMTTALFEHLNDLRPAHPADVRRIAEGAGLDLYAWDACIADPLVVDQVRRHAATGGPLKIKGTPTFFVRGLWADGSWAELRNPTEILDLIRRTRGGEILPGPPPAEAPPTYPR